MLPCMLNIQVLCSLEPSIFKIMFVSHLNCTDMHLELKRTQDVKFDCATVQQINARW